VVPRVSAHAEIVRLSWKPTAMNVWKAASAHPAHSKMVRGTMISTCTRGFSDELKNDYTFKNIDFRLL